MRKYTLRKHLDLRVVQGAGDRCRFFRFDPGRYGLVNYPSMHSSLTLCLPLPRLAFVLCGLRDCLKDGDVAVGLLRGIDMFDSSPGETEAALARLLSLINCMQMQMHAMR